MSWLSTSLVSFFRATTAGLLSLRMILFFSRVKFNLWSEWYFQCCIWVFTFCCKFYSRRASRLTMAFAVSRSRSIILRYASPVAWGRFFNIALATFLLVLFSFFKVVLVYFLLFLPAKSTSFEGEIVFHEPGNSFIAFQVTRDDHPRWRLIELLRTDKFMGNIKTSLLSDNLEKFVNPNFYKEK